MTPVAWLYAMPVPALSEVEEILFWKVFQSAEVNLPLVFVEAVGRLNVMVEPEPVTVKSDPAVEVANVTAGPVVVCPVGPTEVSAVVR